LHRTHTTRDARGALIILVAMVVSLVIGVLGSSAGADDGTTGASTPSDTATTGSPDSGTDSLGEQVNQALGGAPDAVPDSWVVRRGYSTSVRVAANDSCPDGSCIWSKGHSVPSGWGVKVSSTGTVTFKVPAKTTPGRYVIYYKLSNGSSADPGYAVDETYLHVAVTRDSYGAKSNVIFTHPYRKGYRDKIHERIIRSINSVPTGSRIQIASWSFASKSYREALGLARKRGVIVQIVLAQRNRVKNSDYGQLRDKFGTTVTANGSWVKRCSYSCRGIKGTMHSKMFLFSQVYRSRYVTMTGSANLTDFAVTNQWNQMNILRRDKRVYDEAVRIFKQMMLDRKASPMYVSTRYPTLTSYFYPAYSTSMKNDFLMQALNNVHCTGATNVPKGRTVIKIAMYAWYQDRGKWLADRVRQLWQQGCHVQIVYAISSNPVKKVLYSPSGRGRIPMRQILLTNKEEVPIYYLHDKWVAIKGHYGSNRSAALAFQGSFNFSNLGFSSDENFQRLSRSGYYKKFESDFELLWKDRQARAPSPISQITNVERTAPASPTLGTGTYAYMEND
jgi:hypothetical protein